jgi:radical SAM superfamily enzyme YgiQ (UPF0313 family)
LENEMNVLFLYPSWTGEYGIFGHFARRAGVFPPLNLALLGAVTQEAGHQAEIIDAEAERIPMRKLVERAVAKKPDVIGLSGMSPFFHKTVALAKALKEEAPEIIIAVGGSHMTIMQDQAMTDDMDYGFVGDSEVSWPEFLDCLQRGGDPTLVKGLVLKRKGEWIKTGRQLASKDLDIYPIPARKLLPMQKYRLGTLHGRKNFTSIQSFRGCPWKCIFCASDELNTTRITRRSAKSIMLEMRSVIEEFGIRHFMFVDDVLTLHKKHIVEICNTIIDEGLDVTFEGSTRANLIDDELIGLMKKAGLIRLSFGLETVDPELRETMNKKVPIEAYVEANRILNRHGVEALNSVMLGLPGETRETVEKTLTFLAQAKEVHQANFAIAVPYPGTEFHRIAKSGEHGVQLMSDDFSQYRRYGSAVTQVNELGPKELIDLQNEGFVRIYSAPWRWKAMLRKNGLIGGLLMLFRVVRLAIRKSVGMARPFRVHPGTP